MLSNNGREFWTEVRKIKGGKIRIPEFVDDAQGSDAISKLILTNYDNLYNSVSYNQDEMNSLTNIIDSRVAEYCGDQKHCSVDHICLSSQGLENIVFTKSNKHVGNVGHYSDQWKRVIVDQLTPCNMYYVVFYT